MTNYTQFTSQVAIQAGKVLLKYFGKPHQIKHKEGAGIVTEADQAAEDLVMAKILRKFPKSSIITEESGNLAGDKDFCWIIDPLDGTSNYAHHFPWFCVSIALYVGGKAKVGVIYQPVMKELFVAEKGKGAFLNGKRIQVSRCKELKNSLLGTGFYYSKGQPLKEEMETFRRLNEKALAVRRPGSAALDLAYVGCGRYDGFWERGLSSWDVAAGYLIVTEAGGKITNYKGNATTIFERECVASNGKLHPRMLEAI